MGAGVNIILKTELVNSLNTCFVELGKFEGVKKPLQQKMSNNSIKFGFTPISEQVTSKLLKKLKSTKPNGPSLIPAWPLKDAEVILLPHLTFLITFCFLTSEFPRELKKANVLPLFKKGDPENPLNYRPISLTPVFSKILENARRGRRLS